MGHKLVEVVSRRDIPALPLQGCYVPSWDLCCKLSSAEAGGRDGSCQRYPPESPLEPWLRKNSRQHRWQINPPPLFYILSKISIMKCARAVDLLWECDKTRRAKIYITECPCDSKPQHPLKKWHRGSSLHLTHLFIPFFHYGSSTSYRNTTGKSAGLHRSKELDPYSVLSTF